MMRVRGRWSGRPGMSEIERVAVGLVSEFERKLTEVSLEVPVIPPVPVEYMALTLTDFNVRGVVGLACEGQKLSGFLDTENEEICYEENELQARQNFTIAHELGHYFLHYLPDLESANQPTLFAIEEVAAVQPVRFYRCSDQEVVDAIQTDEEHEQDDGLPPSWMKKSQKAYLNDADAQSRLAKVIKLKERANRFEWEANIFATALLMPRELVVWLYQKYDGDITKMAREMGVSHSALRYRLHGLKLNGGNMPDNSRSKKTKKESFNQGSLW
jgi:Zn-dependent peptidase ImmA (M78 family)